MRTSVYYCYRYYLLFAWFDFYLEVSPH